MTKKPIALVDMDGTLADYSGAMTRDLTILASPCCIWGLESPPVDPGDLDKIPHMKARMDLIKNQPDWWFNLARLEGGFKIVDMLKREGYKIHVLTKGPKRNVSAWTEKVRWVQKHLPNTNITITHDKGLVYGRVLVDDWPSYIEAWLKFRPRGLVIMPDQPWNKDFSHPQVIRFDGNNYLEVYSKLVEHRSGNV